MKIKELWQKVNEENADLLFNLYERWQEEKEYEDINDYLVAIQKTIPEAYKISKRPFGVTCKCDDGDLHIFIKSDGIYNRIVGEIK